MPASASPARGMIDTRGRYELRDELARGGMGIVFRAHDRLARREIAYKRLHVENANSRARAATLFEREYATLAQLSHPNIVQVYEYGYEAGTAFYTMELLAGRSMREAVPMSLREGCALLRDVASALALVHARRFVHRDVSPANVRLSPDGRGKLIDFGALTSFGLASDIVGTPPFIAPECLLRKELDARTDLFSFGAVAYWAFTGRTPFAANTLEARIRNLAPEILRPSEHVASLPPQLDELLLSLLHPDPAGRPASAAEVMQRLTTIAELPPEPSERQVALSYLTHPPLVGRDDVLARTRTLLQDAGQGHTLTAVITAGHGLGRTAVVDRVAIDAQLAGCTVLRAPGTPHARAFGVAHALVRAGLTTHPQIEGPRSSEWPARAADNDNSGPAASPVDAVQRHGTLVAALQAPLIEIGRRTPLVILVDDAHLADAESLAVLASLAHEAASSSAIGIVLSVANDAPLDGNAPLMRLMRGAANIRLDELSAQDVLELVISIFGSAPNARRLALWLYEKAHGVPSRSMDLLRLLLHQGVVHYQTGTFSLPHDFDENLITGDDAQARIARLQLVSPTARGLAELLGIQDVGMTIELLATAAKLDPREVVLAAEELRAGGIVQYADGEIAFASETIREAVGATLDDAARRALHLRAARALLDRGDESPPVLLLIGANLLRGGDDTLGIQVLARALRLRWYDPARDATPVPLLESVLEALRRQGRTDQQCVAILVPLVRAGFSADYLVQLRHLDRALSALSDLCGVTLARKLRPLLGPRASLFLALGCAALRFTFIPRARRLDSFRETMIALMTIATAGSAAAVSAFDPGKAGEILDELKPLEGFPEGSAPRISYEFALAAFEVGSGDPVAATARYTKLVARLEAGPVPDLDQEAHSIYRWGCLYGLAQAELARGSPRALLYADQLQGGHPFYEPHAESTRMAYYALRGEEAQADLCRERAEIAALRGGVSWSSVTVVTVRYLYAYVLWRNPMGILRLIPELARLARLAPNLRLYHDLAAAYLETMRGQPEEALGRFERVLSDPRHASMPTVWLDRTGYAHALCASGRYDEATAVLTEILSQAERFQEDAARTAPLQMLAIVEAAQGKFDAAAARIEGCLAELRGFDHPVVMGSLHRDRARVALLARDEVSFRHHLREMSECFAPTKNPWLIRQCEQLAAQAKQLGPLDATRGGSLMPGASEVLTEVVSGMTRVVS